MPARNRFGAQQRVAQLLCNMRVRQQPVRKRKTRTPRLYMGFKKLPPADADFIYLRSVRQFRAFEISQFFGNAPVPPPVPEAVISRDIYFGDRECQLTAYPDHTRYIEEFPVRSHLRSLIISEHYRPHRTDIPALLVTGHKPVVPVKACRYMIEHHHTVAGKRPGWRGNKRGFHSIA